MKSIIILGPTASGKTKLGVRVAAGLGGEIISADSRQVYTGMDIGTGKDLDEYTIDGQIIPFHLINIKKAGEKYNLSDYQKDFQLVYDRILSSKKTAVIVGGTGLYIEAILKNHAFSHVPNNLILRQNLEGKSREELTGLLRTKNATNIHFDTSTIKRLIRAIEICDFLESNKLSLIVAKQIDATIFGIRLPRNETLKRIKIRLKERLDNGMIEEVRNLLNQGITPEDLIYYGLEYKFITLHLQGKLNYDEMVEKLNVGIRQFAKRQMTWFRRMERQGFVIHWIDGMKPLNEQCEFVINVLNQ